MQNQEIKKDLPEQEQGASLADVLKADELLAAQGPDYDPSDPDELGWQAEQAFYREEQAAQATKTPAAEKTIAPAAIDQSPTIADEKLAAEEKKGVPEMTLDPLAMKQVEASRAREFAQARETLALNAIEPNVEKQRQQLAGEEETKRSAWLKKAEQTAETQPAAADKSPGGNQVESDEVFTARQSEVKPIVPPEIENQYLRVGDKFYHSKNHDLLAFEDKGNKLETKSNSENIAESMVRIAEARGWDEIKVTGTEAFRKEVWFEAASRGMHVKGYEPSEQDKAALAKRVSEMDANKIEKENKPFRARENEKEQTADRKDAGQSVQESSTPRAAASNEAPTRSGADIKDAGSVLVAHGAAKYMHDEKNNDSYYVTTMENGKEKTSWGVDLERAVKESGANVGDKVLIANEGQKQVTVTVPVRDDKGKIIGSEAKEVHRNAWNVKMAETFSKESAAEAVKKHPELAGAAAAVAAMDKKAEADGLTPAQRAIVSARVRENVVNSIERGNIPEVKIKEEIEVKREVNQELEASR